jgi:hypothetical protein
MGWLTGLHPPLLGCGAVHPARTPDNGHLPYRHVCGSGDTGALSAARSKLRRVTDDITLRLDWAVAERPTTHEAPQSLAPAAPGGYAWSSSITFTAWANNLY